MRESSLLRYIVERKDAIKRLKKDVKERAIEVTPTKDFILSIVGPRRAGKTYLIYNFIKKENLNDEEYLFVNFEEIEANLSDLLDAHAEIYGRYPEFLFLDEIQALKGWEREVYRLYETKRFFIFVTGSSSKFLSKEIATQLRGRSLSIRVYPFSFSEIAKLHDIKRGFYSGEIIAKIKKLLQDSIKEGCYPDVVLKKIEASKFFAELIDLVIYKDIVERYGISSRNALEFFIKSAIASNSRKFSINKTYNTARSMHIRVSKNTLYNFQRFLEDVNIMFFLKKYSKSLRKIEISLPKAYVVDNGIYSFTTYEFDIGNLMESFVFQELIKRGYEPSKNLFYFGENYEVDFVIKDARGIKQLIQVTYASGKDEIEGREIKGLLKASELLSCRDLMIITWDYEDKLKFEGKNIKFVPLWKWVQS